MKKKLEIHIHYRTKVCEQFVCETNTTYNRMQTQQATKINLFTHTTVLATLFALYPAKMFVFRQYVVSTKRSKCSSECN